MRVVRVSSSAPHHLLSLLIVLGSYHHVSSFSQLGKLGGVSIEKSNICNDCIRKNTVVNMIERRQSDSLISGRISNSITSSRSNNFGGNGSQTFSSSSSFFMLREENNTRRISGTLYMATDDNDGDGDAATTSTSTSTTPTASKSNDSNNQITAAERLRAQARKTKLEAEKLEAELTLQKIASLEDALSSMSTSASTSMTVSEEEQKKKKEIKSQIQNLAKNIDPSLALLSKLPLSTQGDDDGDDFAEILPVGATITKEVVETNLYKNNNKAKLFSDDSTNGKIPVTALITEAELQSAVELYVQLPKPMKKTLANIIDLNDDYTSPSVIILGLYELLNESSRETVSISGDSDSSKVSSSPSSPLLSPTRLQRLYNEQLEKKKESTISTLDSARSLLDNDSSSTRLTAQDLLAKPDEETKLETMIESFLPRVTRKEGLGPTLAEINMLKTEKILGKDTFQLSAAPQAVPGGYILRGSLAPKLRGDCNKLIDVLDEKINAALPEWKENFQVNVMNDPTPELFENQESFDGDIVLVVHSADLKPTTSQLLKTGVTTLSLFLSFVFSLAVFSQNDVVMERLTSANAVGDFDLTWFNALITPLLVSVGFTQACHEAGHLFVAKKDDFKITPPTILPLVALPYMSFQQNIKTSPKNFESLFNFGAIGPAIGMAVSSAFFLVGLQLTLSMDASALEYAPSVPVLFLKLSTLGGTIVDNVIGGGQGIITQQDPLTPVKLHPFAIGGLASLMINCLDTIPIPGTDGGRMSQSLLGRSGQVAFGGVVYFALLAYTFLSGHKDIFLTFLFINSFARQDNEIPCRNEIDRANLGQAAIALVMWCIAILALTPLD